jgi:hypothetical protein
VFSFSRIARRRPDVDVARQSIDFVDGAGNADSIGFGPDWSSHQPARAGTCDKTDRIETGALSTYF